eukprot:TRINITY_DN6238_c0_g2_i1.p2 TRINITY_DN6238_c0_g2~~TRINITY_DN6238_c0_g2_i1.p2  ORF type:complete len:123 (-),score=39.59 TRINITY_DN6238_c0_g2_i1:365-733(-)
MVKDSARRALEGGEALAAIGRGRSGLHDIGAGGRGLVAGQGFQLFLHAQRVAVVEADLALHGHHHFALGDAAGRYRACRQHAGRLAGRFDRHPGAGGDGEQQGRQQQNAHGQDPGRECQECA